jgi:lipopolysaccharide export LptBFGC system permease protein LptF
MCVTAAAMAATQVGLSLYGANQAEKANDAANARAWSALNDTGDAIIQNLGFQTAEINRQVGDINQSEMEGLSDFERNARSVLGNIRARETALTSGSMARIYFENNYVTNESRSRIKGNAERGRDAMASEKVKLAMDARNSWTSAMNGTQNVVENNNADSAKAWMGAVSDSVSAYGQYAQNKTSIKQSKGEG